MSESDKDKVLKEALKRALDPTMPLEEYRQKIFGNYPSIREQLAMASITSATMITLRVADSSMDRLDLASNTIELALAMADRILREREGK